MGRKTNQQIMEEKIANSLSVGELKTFLDTLPDDMLIGKSGHFGEFHNMHISDLSVTNAYVTPTGWRDTTQMELKILNIDPPDIGDEPD